MTKTLRISDPADLLGYLPHHLGFQPQESVVALSIQGIRNSGRSRVGLTMRIDISDLTSSGSAAASRAALRPHLEEDGAQAAFLALYSNTNPAAELISNLLESFDDELPLVGFWVVTPDYYYEIDLASWSESGEVTFPAKNKWRSASELASTETAVAAVYSGSNIAPTRDALGDIPRAPRSLRDRAQRAALRWRQRKRVDVGTSWALDSWQLWEDAIKQQVRFLRGDEGISAVCNPPILGKLQVALEDIKIRDAVLISNIPDIGDLPARSVAGDAREEVGRAVDLILNPKVALAPGRQAQAVTDILSNIYAHCAQNRATPALTLLAWIAWWKGDGARCAVLIDKALHLDPAYSMARLVARMVEVGMPPGWVRRQRELTEVG